MFEMAKELGRDVCFQCGKTIETVDDFSIEHKTAWIDPDDPNGLFFDLDNVAFSHLSCNCAAAYRKTWKERGIVHGVKGRRRGCRCKKCYMLRMKRRRSGEETRKEERVANSMVEYSAFNRSIAGSTPRQPTKAMWAKMEWP